MSPTQAEVPLKLFRSLCRVYLQSAPSIFPSFSVCQNSAFLLAPLEPMN